MTMANWIHPLLFAGGGGPLLYDTFEDVNATLLINHTPDIDTVGGGWVFPAGTWDIRGNQASISAGIGGVNGISVDSGLADAILTCVMNTGNARYVGIQWRASAINDYVFLHLSVAEDKLQVWKNVLGVRTEIANVACVVAFDTIYNLRVIMAGTSLKVEVDDVELVDIVEPHNQNDSGVGLWQWDGNLWHNARWDNITVVAL